jgi:ligand-binding sensor domain-containing protein
MNAWVRGLLLPFFVLMPMSIVDSQPTRLQFRHLTPDDGLSSSTVTCFLQDHKGFMWIGTYYGLNRYDGYTFNVYSNNSADSTSLPHNLVWTLFEDHENNILIGTSAGLSAYNWKKDEFTNYMQEKSSPLSAFKYDVHGIDEDSLGNLWLATGRGLIYFDRKTAKLFVIHWIPIILIA